MQLRVFFLASLVLSGVALVLHAQTKEKGSKRNADRLEQLKERFEELDKNADHQLSRDELGESLFRFLNTDQDQSVTLDEAKEAIRSQGMAAFQEAIQSRQAVRPATASSSVPLETSEKSELPSLREGPRQVVGKDFGVGRMIEDLQLEDIDGHRFRLSDLKESKAIVLAMTNTTCPVCKKYLPTLTSLEQRWKDSPVSFVYLNATSSDRLADIRAALKNHSLKGRYVRDDEGRFALAIGATKTTDAMVLDAKRTLVYRGAIDDQYGFGYSTDAPKKNYLSDAIAATLEGNRPPVEATLAPGCPLDLSQSTVAQASMATYHNRISRIVQRHCLECHREGGAAPFSLATYEELAGQSGAIRQVLEKNVMPPWFAAPLGDGKTSPFANDCSLTAADKNDFLGWLAGGKPLGDPADAPLPRQFVEGWHIGKPDHIVQVPSPIAVKATGTMPYQNVVVETGLTETKYLRALEVKPTAREVVHHVLVFVAPPASRRGAKNDSEEVDERSGFFAAYAPGYDALIFNEGYGKVLPAGSRLKFQIHYTPNGTATQDQPMLGMIFAKEKPEHLVDVVGVAQPRLAIPPNAAHHEVVATQKLPQDATILAFFPHMHLRGKAFRYEALLPNGETDVLLDIPRYDFNWQLSYRLSEPIRLPAGATIRATAWYDNSAGNLANPDPNKTVRWGQQTFDEMMIGYIEYHMEDGSLGRGAKLAELREQIGSGRAFEFLFKRFDRNGDGKISGNEISGEQKDRLLLLDRDRDGSISLEEAKRLTQLRD